MFSISLTNHGDAHVRTMCDYHAEREKEHFTEVDGLICAGKTSVAGMFSDAVLFDKEVAAEAAAKAVKMAQEMIDGEGQ